MYNVTGRLPRVPTDAHVNKAYCAGRGIAVIDQLFWDTLLDTLAASNVTLVFGVNAAIGRPNPDPVTGAPPAEQRWSAGPSGFDELLRYVEATSLRNGQKKSVLFEIFIIIFGDHFIFPLCPHQVHGGAEPARRLRLGVRQ